MFFLLASSALSSYLSIMGKIDVASRLFILRANLSFERSFGKTCPGCNRKYPPPAVSHPVSGNLVCAECADQHLYNTTGCRFGEGNRCGHDDCTGERTPLLCSGN